MITQEYEAQRVLTATPMELILILYDGCIRCLNSALVAYDDVATIDGRNKVHGHLLEAQSYITELTCSLDVERGGEMAIQIERLYAFMVQHLVDANISGERAPIEEVKRMIEELREGWAQAMESLPRRAPEEQVVPVDRSRSFQFSG
jgi:flagellar secretion chaperone FliS